MAPATLPSSVTAPTYRGFSIEIKSSQKGTGFIARSFDGGHRVFLGPQSVVTDYCELKTLAHQRIDQYLDADLPALGEDCPFDLSVPMECRRCGETRVCDEPGFCAECAERAA